MSKRVAKRVLLVGWDAADWQIIRPLIDRGGMPNVKRFLDEGVHGSISTLHPVLSPILWNSIATGKRADKHDILGFVEPDGQGFVRNVSSTSRKAKAVWNILSQNDLRSLVVGWYASYPAERVKGAVVTDRYEAFVHERDRFAADENAYHPASLREPLREMHVGPHDIPIEMVRPFIPRVDEIDTSADPRPGIFAQMLAQCASVHNAATYLVETEEFDFAAVYYTAIDHFGHAFQEFHPPRMDHVTPEDFALYHQVITSVYQYHDMMLGRLLELAGPETTVILLSDHGFKNREDRPKIFVDPETRRRSGPGLGPVAWHRDFGVFAAMGPGIARGREVRGISLLDICPTILALLGLPVGRDMDGHVIAPAFAEPPRVDYVDTHEGERPGDGVHRGEHVEDPYAAQEVLKQLAELGYVEAPGEDKEKVVRRTIRERKNALATVLFSAARPGEAAAVLRDLLDEEPDSTVRYRLCNVLAALGRYDEVEQLLAGEHDEPEQTPLLSILRGKMLLSQGHTEEALEIFRRIQASHPGMPRIRSLIARPLIRHQRWDEAEAVLREALEINPEDAEAFNLLGLALRGKGETQNAVHAFMKSVTLHHDQPVAHINLGITLAMEKQWEWAIRAFEVALELRPENPVAHRWLGRMYHRVKRDETRARQHLQAARVARAKSQNRIFDQQLDYGQW